MILSTALYYEGVLEFCVLFMKTTCRVMSGFGYTCILRITMRPLFFPACYSLIVKICSPGAMFYIVILADC